MAKTVIVGITITALEVIRLLCYDGGEMHLLNAFQQAVIVLNVGGDVISYNCARCNFNASQPSPSSALPIIL